MSRPTQEMVEDNLLTWKEAIYELHREIDKLDQELDILRHENMRLADELHMAIEDDRGVL